MQCKICRRYFDRGTSTLPNDYCDKCLKLYVQFIEIKPRVEEQILHYSMVVEACQEEIDKCKKTIQRNEETIKFAENEIKKLT